MDKIITLTYLINVYYNVCDNWTEYLPEECTPTEIAEYRQNIVNTIYLIAYQKMPLGGDNFKILRLLNNDITSERFTAQQIIDKLNIAQ